MSIAIYQLDLPVYEKAVLWFLKEFSQDHKDLFPSYDTIAASCGMSRRKAIYVVKKLVELGLASKEVRIEKVAEQTKQSTNLYTLNAPPAPKNQTFSASPAPYKSFKLSLKTEEEEYIYHVFKEQVGKFKISQEIEQQIINNVPDLLSYSPEAIRRTFKKAMNRIRIGSGIYNLPKWFESTVRNENFYLEQQKEQMATENKRYF